MARASNTVERRREIVDAMLRVMARQGYERASVASIAKAAGLTPGLVHYHFRSKQDILVALVDRLGRIAGDRFEARVLAGTPPRERLFAFIDAFLKLGEGADPDAVACWVALGTEALTRPEVGAAYRRVVGDQLAMLTELVRAVLEDEGGDAARAGALASGILCAIEGAFRLATIAPDAIPEGSAASTVRAMAAGLLR